MLAIDVWKEQEPHEQNFRISTFFNCMPMECLMTGATATAHAGATLDRIKAAGSLPCGINIEEPEYSTQDAHGNHAVSTLDICKAVAVAVLGPNAKFTVMPFRDEQDALKALKSGQIALLATGSPNFINTATSIRPTSASASRGRSSMTTRAFL